jgi:hypothetical protein
LEKVKVTFGNQLVRREACIEEKDVIPKPISLRMREIYSRRE